MRRASSAGVAVLLLVVLAACASMPPDRVAMNALKTMRTTSESILKVHAKLYDSGQSSPERRAKIDAAYVVLNQSLDIAALGVGAVKSWTDMARLLSTPDTKLGELKALVPEFKE